MIHPHISSELAPFIFTIFFFPSLSLFLPPARCLYFFLSHFLSRWKAACFASRVFMCVSHSYAMSCARSGGSTASAAGAWCVTDATRAVDDPRSAFALTVPGQLQRDVWEHVLLCQFHDVLPGSSIGMVHADARAIHSSCLRLLVDLIQRCVTCVLTDTHVRTTLTWPCTINEQFQSLSFVPKGVAVEPFPASPQPPRPDAAANVVSVFNLTCVPRTAVIELPFQCPSALQVGLAWCGRGVQCGFGLTDSRV
jgi:hypothetical protein